MDCVQKAFKIGCRRIRRIELSKRRCYKQDIFQGIADLLISRKLRIWNPKSRLAHKINEIEQGILSALSVKEQGKVAEALIAQFLFVLFDRDNLKEDNEGQKLRIDPVVEHNKTADTTKIRFPTRRILPLRPADSSSWSETEFELSSCASSYRYSPSSP